jgi:outer membrane protein
MLFRCFLLSLAFLTPGLAAGVSPSEDLSEPPRLELRPFNEPPRSAKLSQPKPAPAAPEELPPLDVESLTEEAEEGLPAYTLKDCLNLALQQNPDVRVAQKRVEAAAGGVIVARAGFLPNLTNYNFYEKRDTSFANTGFFEHGATGFAIRPEAWQVSIRLNQPIFSSGAVESQYRIARLQQDQSFLAYRAVVDRVLRDVRSAFYEVLLNRAKVAVRRQAVRLLEGLVEYEKSRYASGLSTEFNVMRAQVNLANERPALIASENDLKNSQIRLCQLLNIRYDISAPRPPFVVVGKLVYEPASFSLEDCLAKAEASRPELASAKKQVEIERRQLIVDRSQMLPQVGAFVGYDILDQYLKSAPNNPFFGPGSISGYIAGINLNWQIFDGLTAYGQMKATKARMQAAEIDVEKVRQTVFSEVRQALNDLEKGRLSVESQRKNVEAARKSFELAEANYKAGVASQLDLLQARWDLTQALVGELTARYQHLTALAELQRAISGQYQILLDQNPLPPALREGQPRQGIEEQQRTSPSKPRDEPESLFHARGLLRQQ